jgi:hypothetical protein
MSPSDFPFQTVDPKYIHFLMLTSLLIKLNVIQVVGQKKHSFSIASTMMGNVPKPKGHWIPLAIVSLSADFVELEFGPGKR